jgi:hypothetical protein
VGKALFNRGGCFGGDNGFAGGVGHAVDLPLVGALLKRPIISFSGKDRCAVECHGGAGVVLKFSNLGGASRERGMPVIGSLVTFVTGLILGVCVKPLQEWFFYHPELSVKFNPRDGRCIVDSPQCRWARVSVINNGQIHLRQCQAFVSNVEQKRGLFWGDTTPKFSDSLALEWAVTGYDPRDLPRKIPFFANILVSEDTKNELWLTVYDWGPERLRKIFTEHGRYRITVTVTGDQVKPKTTKIIVRWKGNWKFETSRARFLWLT